MGKIIKRQEAGNSNQSGRRIVDVDSANEIPLLPLKCQRTVWALGVHREKADEQESFPTSRTP